MNLKAQPRGEIESETEALRKENETLREELRKCKIRNLNLAYPKPSKPSEITGNNLPTGNISSNEPVKSIEATPTKQEDKPTETIEPPSAENSEKTQSAQPS